MCGLAGSTDPTVDVEAMLARIRHRGPDGSGVLVEPGVTTGHVRLSIIDPEARSDQPFRYGDGVLAFNGDSGISRHFEALLRTPLNVGRWKVPGPIYLRLADGRIP